MNGEREKIADRIRKLLAKAAGTENENEAMAFSDKAHALLLEHNLSMVDIHDKGEETEEAIIDSELWSNPEPWRKRLAQAAGHLFMCEYFFTTHKTSVRKTPYFIHSFVGTPANVMVCKLMFVYLSVTVDRLARAGAKKKRPGMAPFTKTEESRYRRDFRTNCAERIMVRAERRVEEAKQGGTIETESGTTLPALLSLYEKHEQRNQAAIKAVLGDDGLTVPAKRKEKTYSILGQLEGTRAGDEISLDQQVEADKTKRIGN